MDIIQLLFAVVNLLLALVVLFGGRLIFERLSRLREDVENLKLRSPDDEATEKVIPSLGWKE